MNQLAQALLLALSLSVVKAQLACVNGVFQPDTAICECHDCWTGPLCDSSVSGCVLPIETNQAYVCEEYWATQRARQPSVTIDAVYRTGYQPSEYWVPGQPIPGVAGLLVNSIRELHRRVGNAHTDGYSIAIAHGGSQLIQAAFYALARQRGAPQDIYCSSPFYYLMPYFADTNPGISAWRPDLTAPTNHFAEFLISPNNPNGVANVARFNRFTIHDAVFKWPLYTQDYAALERQHEITIFSLSKITGHSSSRMGWALVRDPELARYMSEYVYITTHGVTMEAQYRAAALLQAVLDDGSIFSYVSSTLQSRWTRALAVFERQSRGNFMIEGARDFCLMWVRCVATPTTCVEVFHGAGLRVRGGREFGGTNYVRFNMMVHNVNFDMMLSRIESVLLASDEELRSLAAQGAAAMAREKYTSVEYSPLGALRFFNASSPASSRA